MNVTFDYCLNIFFELEELVKMKNNTSKHSEFRNMGKHKIKLLDFIKSFCKKHYLCQENKKQSKRLWQYQ